MPYTFDDTKSSAPNLHGLFGRHTGQAAGFKYTVDNQKKAIVWADDTLFKYLTNSKKYIPGTIMAFAGFKKEQGHNNVITILLLRPEAPNSNPLYQSASLFQDTCLIYPASKSAQKFSPLSALHHKFLPNIFVTKWTVFLQGTHWFICLLFFPLCEILLSVCIRLCGRPMQLLLVQHSPRHLQSVLMMWPRLCSLLIWLSFTHLLPLLLSQGV
jgi:hypothetical protein